MNYFKNFTVLILLFFSFVSYSQKNLTYQIPKKEILDLVDVDRAPSVLKDEKNNYMVFVYRPEYKSIDELSQKEMRLGGLRVNPYLNIGSRTTYYNKVKILRLKKGDKAPIEVKGLPINPKLSNFVYSPDQSKIAMINTTSDRLELWVLNIEKALARRINTPSLNATLGSVCLLYTSPSPRDRG